MMTVRKSHVWLLTLSFGFSLLAVAMFACPRLLRDRYDARIASQRRLVAELEVTDLCLFTDARYARHLSQADWHAPFQDNPTTLDYFPSGSMVMPPETLKGSNHAMGEKTDQFH